MSDNYEVGYRKPPKGTQFQQGCSGNPQGRPKGTKNMRTDLREELSEQIVIREGGRAIKVSKQRALIKSLTAKAIKGDVRATMALMSTALQLLEQEGLADEAARETLGVEEREVYAELKKRMFEEHEQSPRHDTDAEEEEEEKNSDE